MQQRINEFKDKLRAGIDVGKWRAQALKLGYNRTNREKERKQAIEALGVQAWQQRIEHPDYADTFADLVALEQQRAGIQARLTIINEDIQREEARKQQLAEQFSPRIHELEQQKKAAAERQAAQEEMSQYDQQLAALKEEQQKALQPMQDRLAELRQQARNEQSQIAELEKQFTPLQHSLGEQVDRVRPESSDLHEHYARIDALNQDIARTADEIDTLNQRIGTAGAGALRPLYWLAGGAVVTVLVLVLIVPMIIGGAGSSDLFGSGTVSERQIREDLVGRTLGTPFYGSNLNWSIEDNSIQSLNVIERRTDRNAGTEDIHAE
jgi:DNA repair exonuclease SbcCD ATPase subunit